eukprot:m.235891 g.235891  ORF g.235891 m.235891 type:complete len:50 (-) comp17410_c0_seq2:1896-2045(-)
MTTTLLCKLAFTLLQVLFGLVSSAKTIELFDCFLSFLCKFKQLTSSRNG